MYVCDKIVIASKLGSLGGPTSICLSQYIPYYDICCVLLNRPIPDLFCDKLDAGCQCARSRVVVREGSPCPGVRSSGNPAR